MVYGNAAVGNFEIGRFLRLKSETRNLSLDLRPTCDFGSRISATANVQFQNFLYDPLTGFGFTFPVSMVILRPYAVASGAFIATPATFPFIPTITASAHTRSADFGGTYSLRIRDSVSLHSGISSPASV